MALALTTKKRPSLYCSFCGKRDSEVGYLVAGPTVFICNECVELCREIGQQELVSNAVTEKEGDLVMLPEAAEAVKIADEHLAGKSVERRKALALDIQQAIILHAGRIAEDAISKAFASASRKH